MVRETTWISADVGAASATGKGVAEDRPEGGGGGWSRGFVHLVCLSMEAGVGRKRAGGLGVKACPGTPVQTPGAECEELLELLLNGAKAYG